MFYNILCISYSKDIFDILNWYKFFSHYNTCNTVHNNVYAFMQPDTVRATGFRYPQNTFVDLEILDHIYKQVYKIKKQI